LLNDYEVCMQWACLHPDLPSGLSEAQIGDRLRHVAMKRIRGNPGALVPLAMDEYVAAWTIGARTHPTAAPLYDHYVSALRPVPMERRFALTGALSPTQPRLTARVAQPLFFAMGWAMIAIIFFSSVGLARNWDCRSLLLIALCAAITVQSTVVMTAVLAVGYPRYTMALWPIMVSATVLLLAWITAKIGKQKLSSRGSIPGLFD
jgi:hypothetical protein